MKITEYERLRSDNERLRKALQQIIDGAEYMCYAHTGDVHENECAVSIARAALKDEALSA